MNSAAIRSVNFVVRLLACITDMSTAQIFRGFWKWLTFYHSRELSITKAELALSEQQKRAEIFALDQQAHTLESERDSLKLEIAAMRIDAKQKDEKIDQLHKDLDLTTQHLNLYRGDSTTYDKIVSDMKAEIATLKARLGDAA